jgi:hypothetical protein
VNNRVATLIERQMADRRDYRACRSSLSDPIEFGVGESVELGDTVSGDDYEARIGRNSVPSRERAELQFDVNRVIANLPAELAAVAILLKFVSVVDAGHRLGLSRATVYRRISDIRETFAEAGLDDYIRQDSGRGRCRKPAASLARSPGSFEDGSSGALDIGPKKAKRVNSHSPGARPTFLSHSTRVQISCLTAFRTLKTMDIAQL